VALQDRSLEKSAQTLAVYRFENKALRLVAQTSLPQERIAFSLSVDPDQPGVSKILVRAAAPGDCQIGGDRETTGSAKAYVLDGNQLRETQP
jgi:hypothetical protein